MAAKGSCRLVYVRDKITDAIFGDSAVVHQALYRASFYKNSFAINNRVLTSIPSGLTADLQRLRYDLPIVTVTKLE